MGLKRLNHTLSKMKREGKEITNGVKYEIWIPFPAIQRKTPARTDVRWWRASTRFRSAERDVERNLPVWEIIKINVMKLRLTTHKLILMFSTPLTHTSSIWCDTQTTMVNIIHQRQVEKPQWMFRAGFPNLFGFFCPISKAQVPLHQHQTWNVLL